MAKLVLTAANVSLNGTDITSNVAAVTLSTSAAEVPTTSFGSSGAVTRVSGLIDNSVTLSVHNDYNAIDGLILPLIGSTAVTMVVKPAGTAGYTFAGAAALTIADVLGLYFAKPEPYTVGSPGPVWVMRPLPIAPW